MTPDDPMWDDLFHGCSFAAFVSEARTARGWPDSKAVKRKAYAMYEAELERKNAVKSGG